ncbi:hypothetical protein GCM10009733_020330 [Nonomuraea maheshkhaliensis]|uniref:DUF3560 domain-containing protein n=1 Tax=Nonomuraea maheshkhaliensis TaxID=419590 RepID=A0ABN2EZE0_9ACTN
MTEGTHHAHTALGAPEQPEPTLTIVHDRQHGTIVYGTTRRDSAGPILHAAGFRGSDALDVPINDELGDAYWYVPHSRRRHADRWKIDQAAAALRDAGWHVTVTIDNTTPATGFWALEAERAARAQTRAERLEQRSQTARGTGQAILAANDATYGALNGTPLLVDHYSYQRHKRLLERLWKRDSKAFELLREADALLGRAQAARNFRNHREGVGVTRRRIAELEKHLRDIERTMAGRTERWAVQAVVEGSEPEKVRRSRELTERGVPFAVISADDSAVQVWLGLGEHSKKVLLAETVETVEEIAYWEDLIEASGKKVWRNTDFTVGDYAFTGGRWREVVGVSLKSLTVPDRLTSPTVKLQSMAELAHHMRHPTTSTMPYDQVHDQMTAQQARERFPEAFAYEDLPPLPPRPAARRGKVRLSQQNGPQHEAWHFIIGGQTYRASWQQPESWYGPPNPIKAPAPIRISETFGQTSRPAELITELSVPADVRWREEIVNVLRVWVEQHARAHTAEAAAPGAPQ